jgi:PHD/YefM family antitoxin component YafN of YafNO toxin-antitoxin module
MTGLEALQSVQYVTVGKNRVAVVDLDDWESLIEWLETIEDAQIVKEAYAELKASGGDRERAGWRRWEEFREELG